MRVLNRLGSILSGIGIDPIKLDRARILQHAGEVARFEFHDEQMEEGLERLIAGLNSEAKLNTFGKIAVRRTVQRSADQRFLIETSLAEKPSISEESIESPLFVIGMPRTGTTILQALLYRDPVHRSLLCWECLLPYPAPSPEQYKSNNRIDQVRSEFEQMFSLVPDFRQKHYMEEDSPQECVGIIALNFTSFQYLAQCFMPSYHEWIANEADQVANMRWHKSFLQFLQSGGVRRKRWLLKSPIHLSRLRALFNVYPDARVVVTHRHPASVVPSVASLLTSVRSLYSDYEDSARSGEESLRIWSSYFDRFLADRKSLDKESQIFDVRFEDFVQDHLGVVESIYRQFGWELRDEVRRDMQAFLEQEQKDKHGRHEYSLEQFGISESAVTEHCRNYLDFLNERFAPVVN